MNRIAPPAAAPWPAAFSVVFVTNVTQEEAATDGAWGAHAVKGELFFEASRRQRVVHGAGARECERFYRSAECALVFAEGAGMFALTERETKCCLDMPELSTPPANWTTEAKHHFIGTKRFKGRMCHGFRYRMGLDVVSGQGGAGGHIYYQDSATRLPCAFEFIGDDRLAWFFDVQSLREGPQDPTLFTIPDSCASHRCPTAATGEGKQAVASSGKGGGVGGVGGVGGEETRGAGGSSAPSTFEGLVDEVVGLVETSSQSPVSTH